MSDNECEVCRKREDFNHFIGNKQAIKWEWKECPECGSRIIGSVNYMDSLTHKHFCSKCKWESEQFPGTFHTCKELVIHPYFDTPPMKSKNRSISQVISDLLRR